MEKIQCLTVGPFETNCYLLRKNNGVLIIDPGAKAERIINAIDPQETVVGILLTHGHFDHIGAADELAGKYSCAVYCSEEDEVLLKNPQLNKMGRFQATLNHDFINWTYPITQIEGFSLEIIEAPGHTDGSVLIFFEDCLFAGDVLFQGGIGRCDLYSGNESKMKQSLKLIKTLNPGYRIFSGHGPSSTLEKEFMTNPYLR